MTFLSCKTFITTLPFSAGSLYFPGTRRALWDLGRLLLLMWLQVPDVITHHAASSYPFAGWLVSQNFRKR